ncbi:MAG TPA: TetR/AcrR family transcriptional regulator [Polyangiaceae bacterium]
MAKAKRAARVVKKVKKAVARAGGRSARVVDDVLNATLAELVRSGYGALRVEDVAHAAGVNKTTVYRRWATKMALVTDALKLERMRTRVDPDTGSLKGDLRIILESLLEIANTPLSVAWNAELRNPEVRAIIQDLRRPFEIDWTKCIARGMARGELPPRTSPILLLEVLVSPVAGRMMRGEELPDRDYCDRLIDLVIAGARAVGRKTGS